MWYIVQFHTEGKRFRLVNECLVDGYEVGDRFLEGADFKVTIIDGGEKFKVEATDDTKGYLEGVHSDPTQWSKDITDCFLREGGHDMMHTTDKGDGWDAEELHLTQEFQSYINDGYEHVQEG